VGSLGGQAFEVGIGEIDVTHGVGNPVVTGHFGDLTVHLVSNASVTGVALRSGAKFDEVHGLAGVHLDHVADAKRQCDAVGSVLGQLAVQGFVEVPGTLEGGLVGSGQPRPRDDVRHVVTKVSSERLPLHGRHAVALKVAEGAVVGHQFEAVVRSLEGPTRAVSAIGPIADVGSQQPESFLVAHRRHGYLGLGVGPVAVGEDDGLEDAIFAPRVEVDESDRLFGGCVVHVWRQVGNEAAVAVLVVARYCVQRTPRSGTSTRRKKEGMTLTSSSSIICE
jgi:hypothetical protein